MLRLDGTHLLTTEQQLKQSVERGNSWSSTPGVAGLGGIRHEVTVGAFNVSEVNHAVVCSLILTRSDIETLVPGPTTQGAIAARVRYGSGLAADSVLLDWNYGTSITVPAGAGGVVTVNAIQRSLYIDGVTNGNMFKRVRLNAMLVAGSRSSLCAPTLTQLAPLTVAGATATIQVPNRVKRLQVNSALGSASDVLVRLFLGPALGPLFALATDPEIRTRGIEIPGATVTVLLSSAAGEVHPITLNWLLDG